MPRIKKMDQMILIDQSCRGLTSYLEKYFNYVERIDDGKADKEILEIAKEKGAYVVTTDIGFPTSGYNKVVILKNGNKKCDKLAYHQLLECIVKNEGHTTNRKRNKKIFQG